MRVRLWLAVGLALALLVAVAGCGGGDEEETTAPAVAEPTTAALSKEELLSQGDAICAEVNAAIGTVASTGADTDAQVAQEADLYEGMVERLKGLGAPQDSAGYEEFIAAADALAQAHGDAALAAARDDTTAMQVAQGEASSALASFQAAADNYGFEQCGEEPRAPEAGSGAGEGAPAETGGVEGGGEGAEEAAPEAAEEAAPETGGAGTTEGEAETGGGAAPGGGTEGGGGSGGSGGGGSGGIGPG